MKVRHVDLYADEWIVGTVELDNAERGLYITACCLIYSTGGAITRDRLRAACRDHGHAFNRQLTALVAKGKLSINGEQITNKRSINELQKAEERTIKAQQNGGKGGRPPNENKDVAKPDGSKSEKLTTNYQLPTTNLKNISSLRSDTSKASASDAQAMIEIWNEELGEVLAAPRKLTPPRMQQCASRLCHDLEGDIENWRALCQRIRRSPFLTQRQEWKATFDWVLKPANMIKVLEGNYDDREPIPFRKAEFAGPKSPPPTDLWEEAVQRTGG